MRELVKRTIRYISSINNKYNEDLREITSHLISELISKSNSKIIDKSISKDKIFSLIEDLKGTSYVESLKIIESVILTMNINGDICEFGVAQGKTSKLISYIIKNTKKKIYLFDSFKGLPKPSKKDILKNDVFNLGKIDSYEGKMSHNESKVISELKSIGIDLNKVEINKGFFNVANIHKYNFPKNISFAYIDFDFYQPTLDVLNFIEDKLCKGSIFIVDDYDFFSTGAKTALDEWNNTHKEKYKTKIIKTNNSSFAIVKKL